MAGNRSAIKARIKSVNATKKITGAMKLISNVKLQKEKARFERIFVYSDELRKVAAEVLSSDHDFDHVYFKENNAEKRFVLYISSDLGMCGAYNGNMLRFLDGQVSKNDLLYVVGTHSYNHLKNEGYTVINDLYPSDGLDPFDFKKIAGEALKMYREGQISGIDMVYTAYLNTISFEPRKITLMPAVTQHQRSGVVTLLEPDPLEVIERLIPMMVENTFYAKYVEAKTAEQASRRLAMENATDNAEELVEKLTLQYNQARQAAITQEITEIVSGADAL